MESFEKSNLHGFIRRKRNSSYELSNDNENINPLWKTLILEGRENIDCNLPKSVMAKDFQKIFYRGKWHSIAEYCTKVSCSIFCQKDTSDNVNFAIERIYNKVIKACDALTPFTLLLSVIYLHNALISTKSSGLNENHQIMQIKNTPSLSYILLIFASIAIASKFTDDDRYNNKEYAKFLVCVKFDSSLERQILSSNKYGSLSYSDCNKEQEQQQAVDGNDMADLYLRMLNKAELVLCEALDYCLFVNEQKALDFIKRTELY
jgi:hypothetical protein